MAREIPAKLIEDTARELTARAAIDIPPDYRDGVRRARDIERPFGDRRSVRVDVRAPSRSAMFRYGQHVSAMGRVFTRHDPLVSKSGRLSRVIHVLFKTAAELLLDLGAQESARGLGRRLNYYATRGLFVIDEIGYLSYDARAADLLFPGRQPPLRAPQSRPDHQLVLTTNLPFSEWPSIFPNAATATALIDRVVHHAEIITMVRTQTCDSGGSERSALTR